MLGRRPKDFDVATDAHPQQVRDLFRNSRLIGRRFRLVHVFFGPKNIEVATFRKQAEGVTDTDDPLSAMTTLSARPKKTRSGATSPSTRCSTIRRLFTSSIMRAESPTSGRG